MHSARNYIHDNDGGLIDVSGFESSMARVANSSHHLKISLLIEHSEQQREGERIANKMRNAFIIGFLILCSSIHCQGKEYLIFDRLIPCVFEDTTVKVGKCNQFYFIENKTLRFVFDDSVQFKELKNLFQQNFFGKNQLINFKKFNCREYFKNTNEKSETIEEFNDPACHTLKTVANVTILDSKDEKDKHIVKMSFTYCDRMLRKYKYRMTYTISNLQNKQVFKVVRFEYIAEEL